MNTRAPTLKTVLASQGYSVTKPRQLLFAAFSTAESLSMSELIKKLDGQVDRASAYRGVELFENLGIIHRLQYGWKYKLELSDMFREHHHHAVCLKCGGDFSVGENKLFEQKILKLGASINFQVTSHMLEMRGLCRDCSTMSTK